MIKRNYSLKDAKMPLNGEAVRMLLTTRGETLTHVCKQLGWSNSYLSHLTLGYTLVRRDNLLKLADYLCVMPTQIMKARLSKKDIKLLEKNRNEMKQAKQKTKEDHTHDLVIEQPKSSQKDKQLELFDEKQGQPLEIALNSENQASTPQKSNAIQEAKAELNKVDDHVDKVKAQLAEIYDSTAKIDALIDVANQSNQENLIFKMLDKLPQIDTIAKLNVFLRVNGEAPIGAKPIEKIKYKKLIEKHLTLEDTLVIVNSRLNYHEENLTMRGFTWNAPAKNDFTKEICHSIALYSLLAGQLYSVIKRGNKND